MDFMKEVRAASPIPSVVGICCVIPMPIPGLVPYVIIGSISSAAKRTSLSNTAFSSLLNVFQYANALSHASPFGAYSRPLIYSKVVSSGATIPPRAPISILRLHKVRRPSIVRLRTASPPYSTKYPVAPLVVIFDIIYNATSFAVTPLPSLPSTVIRIVLGLV